MSFDPKRKFESLGEFNPKKPFERLTGFDPSREFENLDVKKVLKNAPKRELNPQDVVEILWKELKLLPKPKPIEKVIEKQIVKEIRIEEKKDKKEYADLAAIDELKIQIESLKKDLQEATRKIAFVHGGSGVIGIPAPEGNPEGYVLTIFEGKQRWRATTGGTSNADPLNIGDPTVDGNWRITVSGNNLSVQRRESGTFVEKASFNP